MMLTGAVVREPMQRMCLTTQQFMIYKIDKQINCIGQDQFFETGLEFCRRAAQDDNKQQAQKGCGYCAFPQQKHASYKPTAIGKNKGTGRKELYFCRKDFLRENP